jgi:dTDP-4-amino-4,6-dideoxygalactose transaminase
MKIPFAKANIGQEEEQAVIDVLRSGWLTQGQKVKEFEEQFAQYVGAKYAVALNSATSALFLCLRYLKENNDKKRKDVIVPSLTFTASASVIRHNDLKVMFADVKKEDFCLDKDKLEVDEDFNSFILGIISVHLTGNKAITEYKDISIIEDSAHRILPDTQGNNPVCYSFYATKNMTTGEGGMVTTNDENLYNWLRLARLHGSDKNGFDRYKNAGVNWRYNIMFTGWKMNMTDIMAAIGIEQLKKLPQMNIDRQRCIDRYNKNLGLNRTGLHLYPIRIINEFQADCRDGFIQYLYNEGIQTSVHFLPLHKMPAYDNKQVKCIDNLEVTETLGNQLVSLPLYPQLKDEEIDYVCDKVKEYQNKNNIIVK